MACSRGNPSGQEMFLFIYLSIFSHQCSKVIILSLGTFKNTEESLLCINGTLRPFRFRLTGGTDSVSQAFCIFCYWCCFFCSLRKSSTGRENHSCQSLCISFFITITEMMNFKMLQCRSLSTDKLLYSFRKLNPLPQLTWTVLMMQCMIAQRML